MESQLQQLRLLEMERRQLLRKLDAVDKAIFAYGNIKEENKQSFPVQYNKEAAAEAEQLLQKYHDYNPVQSTRNKVLHIIKRENRFLHAREIARIACKLDEEVSTTTVIKKVSPALSILKRMPGSPVISIEIFHSHFNTFWGCREWLTEDGKIREDFMYHAAEIKKTRKIYSPDFF